MEETIKLSAYNCAVTRWLIKLIANSQPSKCPAPRSRVNDKEDRALGISKWMKTGRLEGNCKYESYGVMMDGLRKFNKPYKERSSFILLPLPRWKEEFHSSSGEIAVFLAVNISWSLDRYICIQRYMPCASYDY